MRRAAVITVLAALLPAVGWAVSATAAPQRLAAEDDGFLTRPSGDPPSRVALGYVQRRESRFGLDSGDVASLDLVRSYRFAGGSVHLQWEQSFRGVPVFGAGLRANLDPDGRLINVGSDARPDVHVDSVEPSLSALAALRAAAGFAALSPGTADVAPGPERVTTFASGDRAGLTLAGAPLRLAWRVQVRADATHFYDALVDGETGEVMRRDNLIRSATGLVFDNYPGAPAGGTQQARDFPQTGADPWITDLTRLFGNNAHVYSDPDHTIEGQVPGASPTLGNEIAPSSSGVWSFAHDARPASSFAQGQRCPATPGCSWDGFVPGGSFDWPVNRQQAGTQLFYYLNRFHDHLRDAAGIGFDDSSGNFEVGDRVYAQVDDGANTTPCRYFNNAYAIPVPDGTPLLLQFGLFTNSCSGAGVFDVNSADDALVVYHEYTHGLTNRLVTDAAGMPALVGFQSQSMDEGFGDWYAIDLLSSQGLEPDSATPGELRAGRYENAALRTQAFDCPVGAAASQCPGSSTAGSGGYTYGEHPVYTTDDQGRPVPEVHGEGEIWVETLWDLRTRLMADHGALDGLNRARALVTDGLRLAPAYPDFLDMRDAILQSNVNRGLGDRDRIWAVFAARGMGVNARTTGTNDLSPVADFTVPPAETVTPIATADRTAPRISRLSMTRRRFRVGSPAAAASAPRKRRRTPRGTAFRFRLSENATVRIAIEDARSGRRVRGRCRPATRKLRHRRRCTRYVRVGTLKRTNVTAASQRMPFSGRISGRALRRGVYRAAIWATDAAGNRSRQQRLKFRIVRR